MAAGGGYNAPSILTDTSTSFGSDVTPNHDPERNGGGGGGGGISSQPLFGVDFKKYFKKPKFHS